MHLLLGILSGSIKTLSPFGGCSRREEMLLSTVYGFHCFPSCYFIEGCNSRRFLYSLFKANCKNSTPKFFPDNVIPEIKTQKHAEVLWSTLCIFTFPYSKFTNLSDAGSSSPTYTSQGRWYTLSATPGICGSIHQLHLNMEQSVWSLLTKREMMAWTRKQLLHLYYLFSLSSGINIWLQ